MSSQVSAPSAPTADTRLDAKIFDLILKGQLRDSSSISDGVGPSMLLADHPRFAKVLRLARIHRSLELLQNVKWWQAKTPSWSHTLAARPLAQLFFELDRERATGFLTIAEGERVKVLALSSGACFAVNSNLEREQLAAFVSTSTGMAAEELSALEASAGAAGRPLSHALLAAQKVSVDGLLTVLAHQAHERLLDLFGWTAGEIAFHADERAAQVERISSGNLMSLLRTGVWRRRPASIRTLKVLLGPLVSQPEKLRVLADPGGLAPGLTEAEAAVVAAAGAGRAPAEVVEELGAAADGTDALRALYLFTRLGIVGVEGPDFAQPILPEVDDPGTRPLLEEDLRQPQPETAAGIELPVPAAPAMPPAAPRRMSGSTELKEYRLQLQLEQEGRKLLNARQFADAAGKFEQLAERQERPVAALAYQAVALLLAGGPGSKSRAVELVTKAVGLDGNSALGLAAQSCVSRAQGNVAAAERQQKQALALSQHNDSWYLEVRGLLELGGGGIGRASGASTAAVGAAAALGVLVIAGVALAMGEGYATKEYFYRPSDAFFWIRRGALLVAGLLGAVMVSGKSPLLAIRELGWRAPPGLLILAVSWGAFVGFVSPSQRVTPVLGVVLALTVVHVLAEELFFRAFVQRALLDRLSSPLAAALAAAVIFALYHLTYDNFWPPHAELLPRIYDTASIGLFAGLPLGFLYWRGNGLLAPLCCHLALNGTMMTLSILGV